MLKFYNLEAWLLSGPGQIKGSLSLNYINHIKEIFSVFLMKTQFIIMLGA